MLVTLSGRHPQDTGADSMGRGLLIPKHWELEEGTSLFGLCTCAAWGDIGRGKGEPYPAPTLCCKASDGYLATEQIPDLRLGLGPCMMDQQVTARQGSSPLSSTPQGLGQLATEFQRALWGGLLPVRSALSSTLLFGSPRVGLRWEGKPSCAALCLILYITTIIYF
ncbi:sialate O-acetylesterase [Platysternon megacephalum]|uniref:Sialate O-acetylesterase n=1 Tax=Platysternon megacephalum TaxID=55544 RepID=A0A4D9EMN7_9SAUR|nr:sialate O-acetylesterase [Platysternon megacephalum]